MEKYKVIIASLADKNLFHVWLFTTQYRVLTTLNEKAFEEWEKEKMLVSSIFSYPTMFSTLPKSSFNFSVKL